MELLRSDGGRNQRRPGSAPAQRSFRRTREMTRFIEIEADRNDVANMVRAIHVTPSVPGRSMKGTFRNAAGWLELASETAALEKLADISSGLEEEVAEARLLNAELRNNAEIISRRGRETDRLLAKLVS
jgi:CRISPR/Cas system CSM-associated protein Csm5 (group 7 of RAMP superfamily)